MNIVKKNREKIYYILGEGLAKGGALLLFPFFTNFLDKPEFGRLALYWACLPFLSIFLDFSQRSYLKRIYIEKEENFRASFLSVSFFVLLFTCLLSFIYMGLYLFDISIINLKFDIYLLIAGLFYTLTELFLAFLQIKGNAKQFSAIYLFKMLLPYLLAVSLFLLTQKGNPYYFPNVQITVLVIIVLGLLFKNFRTTDILLIAEKFKLTVKRSFKFSAPLIIGTFSAIGLNVADRIIIKFNQGNEDVANYTVAYTIASILTAFFMATNKWWQRYMLIALEEKRLLDLRKTMRKYLLVVLIVSILIFVLREQLLLWFSSVEYLKVASIIPMLLLGMFFYYLYTLLLNIPFYFKNSFLVVLPALIAFVINTLLNILLIPKMGYEIAATTTMFSYLIEFLIIYAVCKIKYGIDLFFG